MVKIIDEAVITVKAGDGGKGCDSRIRLSDHRLIPDGGEGGRGGNVLIRSDANVTTLRAFLYERHFVAESGGHGGSNRRKGKRGSDLTIRVPAGTAIFQKGTRPFLIRDLLQAGDEVVLVEGGRGGAGNERGRQAQLGEAGPQLEVVLSLKIPAEIFFVGLPSSGKSKLLNRLTRAHAKEDTYPFTTKAPELGVFQTADYTPIHLCELPGIYRQSPQGRGAGVDFLKHLARAKVVALMLDPLSQFASSLGEGYGLLLEVMGNFDRNFLEIPRVVIVNKMDLPEARVKAEREHFQPEAAVFLISAETGEGVEALMNSLIKKLREVHV